MRIFNGMGKELKGALFKCNSCNTTIKVENAHIIVEEVDEKDRIIAIDFICDACLDDIRKENE